MTNIKQRLSTCLWFDGQADEAARFYASLFPGSAVGNITRYGKEGYEIHGQPEGTVMTVDFQLGGQNFMGLNGGPQFKLNPLISFFVVCEKVDELNKLWDAFQDRGMVLMPLDKYDWSERYGWVQDRFGVSWQISLGKVADTGQKITPSFMFVGSQHGRAEEAVNFYTSVFDASGIQGILKYGKGENDPEGTVKHAQFRLAGQTFMAMDSAHPHNFAFNEAISIVVNCDTQKEIDHYWDKLSKDGEEGPCGWLKDKFGVSWQVVPVQLAEMLRHPDKDKRERVTKAFLQMKKFDLEKLNQVFQK